MSERVADKIYPSPNEFLEAIERIIETRNPLEFSRYRHNFYRGRSDYISALREEFSEHLPSGNFAIMQRYVGAEFLYTEPGDYSKDLGKEFIHPDNIILAFGHAMYHFDRPFNIMTMINGDLSVIARSHGFLDFLYYKSQRELSTDEEEVFLKLLCYTVDQLIKHYFNDTYIKQVDERSREDMGNEMSRIDEVQRSTFYSEVSEFDNSIYPRIGFRRLLENRAPIIREQTIVPGFPREKLLNLDGTPRNAEEEWIKKTLSAKDYEIFLKSLKDQFLILITMFELILGCVSNEESSKKYRRLLNLKLFRARNLLNISDCDFERINCDHEIEAIRSSLNLVGSFADNYPLTNQGIMVEMLPAIAKGELLNLLSRNRDPEDPNNVKGNFVEGKFENFTASDDERSTFRGLVKNTYGKFWDRD